MVIIAADRDAYKGASMASQQFFDAAIATFVVTFALLGFVAVLVACLSGRASAKPVQCDPETLANALGEEEDV